METRSDAEMLDALLSEVAALRAENARLRGPYIGAADPFIEPRPADQAQDGLLRAIAEQAVDALVAARCSIWLADGSADLLRVVASAGLTLAEELAARSLTVPLSA